MPRGGRRSTSFQKGKAGGPGRPRKKAEEKARAIQKTAIADLKVAAKELTELGLKRLKQVLDNDNAPAAAHLKALEIAFDRGWGRPEQTTNLNVSVFDQMTDDEQKILLAALTALKDAEEDQPTLN